MSVFNLKYIGIQSKQIFSKEKVNKVFIDEINNAKLKIESGDIIAISSKVVAVEQDRIVDLKTIKPSENANLLAKKAELPANFVQLVIDESESVIGIAKGALLTLNKGLIQANAGIDKSNAGLNNAILLPENMNKFVEEFKEIIELTFGVDNIGILIIDSSTRPLRLGTVGLALSTIGFPAITDDRGRKDLFGYEMKITYKNVADNLASGAGLIMGESDEKIPFVLIRGIEKLANQFNWNTTSDIDLKISEQDCLYLSNLSYKAL